MMHHRHWLLGVALLVAGCASGPADRGTPAPEPADEPEAPAEQPPAPEEEVAEERQAAEEQPEAQYPPMIQAGARVTDIRVEPTPVEVTAGDSVTLDPSTIGDASTLENLGVERERHGRGGRPIRAGQPEPLDPR
jgi:hypothetical protein